MEGAVERLQQRTDQRLWRAAADGDLEEIRRCAAPSRDRPVNPPPPRRPTRSRGAGRRTVALGANLTAGDPELFGRNALHFAAYHGRADAARELVTLGADVHGVSRPLRWAPLHYAAQRGHNATCATLITLGTDRAACTLACWGPEALRRVRNEA
jgi:hypothetical protein